MKTQNRLFTIIVLSIFVLGHILLLHNAISDCADIQGYETVQDYEKLYKDRLKELSDAKDDLKKAEYNDLFASWTDTTIITTATGTVLGTIASLVLWNPAPLAIGFFGGIAAGTVASEA